MKIMINVIRKYKIDERCTRDVFGALVVSNLMYPRSEVETIIWAKVIRQVSSEDSDKNVLLEWEPVLINGYDVKETF